MHTLVCYYCLFCPISALLHTLNSTLYFVLFRTFNSVNHCSYSLLVARKKAKLLIFFNLLLKEQLGEERGWEMNCFCQSRIPRIALPVNHQQSGSKSIDVLAAD